MGTGIGSGNGATAPDIITEVGTNCGTVKLSEVAHSYATALTMVMPSSRDH